MSPCPLLPRKFNGAFYVQSDDFNQCEFLFMPTEASVLLSTSGDSSEIGFSHENIVINIPNFKIKSVDELVSLNYFYSCFLSSFGNSLFKPILFSTSYLVGWPFSYSIDIFLYTVN